MDLVLKFNREKQRKKIVYFEGMIILKQVQDEE